MNTERLFVLWDELDNASQRVLTALPAQMTEAAIQLDRTRRDFRAGITEFAIARARGAMKREDNDGKTDKLIEFIRTGTNPNAVFNKVDADLIVSRLDDVTEKAEARIADITSSRDFWKKAADDRRTQLEIANATPSQRALGSADDIMRLVENYADAQMNACRGDRLTSASDMARSRRAKDAIMEMLLGVKAS